VGRAKDRCKGAVREIASRWARLSLLCNPLKGLLTAYPTRGSTPCAMKRCIIRCSFVKDYLVPLGICGPSTSLCNWNFRTPAWVNNVIGRHGSYLGQLPWDRFTGRVPFTEGFLSSGYQLGFSTLLISLEFFPHTCNNSSKVVKGVPMGLSSGNYCLGMM
jgi:hypothetical protein